MKKIMTLVLALVMVFGVSAMVGAADSAGNIEGNTKLQHHLKVGINVEQYATINVLESEMARYDRTELVDGTERKLVNLSSTGDSEGNAIGFRVNVKSNAPFKLRAEETVSKTLANSLPSNDYVWAFDDDGQDWIVAPNVEIFKTNWSNHYNGRSRGTGDTGRFEMVTFAEDSREEELVVQFNAQFKEESPSGNSFNKLESDAYEGEVILTVSGQ